MAFGWLLEPEPAADRRPAQAIVEGDGEPVCGVWLRPDGDEVDTPIVVEKIQARFCLHSRVRPG
jgi:hypothetical protein